MDYKNLTSPCGRDCFNCTFYLAAHNPRLKQLVAKRMGLSPEIVECEGCRNIEGKCTLIIGLGLGEQCRIYRCSKEKGVSFCYECEKFPCLLLHPVADKAEKLPHNIKVYNLCRIQKVGIIKWAEEEAKQSFERYFKEKLESFIGEKTENVKTKD